MIKLKFQIGKKFTPLKQPFRTALRCVTQIESIVFKIILNDSLIGLGASSPTKAVTGDTSEIIIEGIVKLVAQIEKDHIPSFSELALLLERTAVSNSSKAAFEIAWWDLLSKKQGIPLVKLLNPTINKVKLSSAITISLGTSEEMANNAKLAIQQGFNRLKLKIGSKDIGDDLEIIKILYELKTEAIEFILDINQAWSLESCLKAFEVFEKNSWNFLLIEQPLKADNISGLTELRRKFSFEILADESVFSVEDARNLYEVKAYDRVNIKLMKVGGFSQGEKMVDFLKETNQQAMMGMMLEGPIGALAAAHFAAAKAEVINVIDIDGLFLADVDINNAQVCVSAPHIIINENAKGLGLSDVVLDEVLQTL